MTQSDPTQGIAAAFAHELIGPVSSVGHSLELLEQQWQSVLKPHELALWRAGYTAHLTPPNSESTHSPINTSKLERRLAVAKAKNPAVAELTLGMLDEALDKALKYFEIGYSYKCARLGVETSQQIIKSLRAWGVPSGNAKTPNVNLADTLQTAWTILHSRTKNLQICWDVNECPSICANPHELAQVWMNILLNASQVNPEGCRATVSLTNDNDNAYVTITNSGKPIPANLKIFEKGQTAREGGTGLGLHLCKNIIEAHGGKISAQSGTEGGAVFSITLPLATQQL